MSINNLNLTSPRQQQGVGLIEVLVAVLVLAIGLLGIAALQAVTLKNTTSSTERTQAVMQAYTALDMLRANQSEARAGNFNQTWQAGTATTVPNLNTTAGWLSNLLVTVGPSAEGMIECDSAAECKVGVRWSEEQASGGDATPQTFEITSRL